MNERTTEILFSQMNGMAFIFRLTYSQKCCPSRNCYCWCCCWVSFTDFSFTFAIHFSVSFRSSLWQLSFIRSFFLLSFSFLFQSMIVKTDQVHIESAHRRQKKKLKKLMFIFSFSLTVCVSVPHSDETDIKTKNIENYSRELKVNEIKKKKNKWTIRMVVVQEFSEPI